MPIVPPSFITISSLNVTIPVEEICIASVELTEPMSPSFGTVILPVTARVLPLKVKFASASNSVVVEPTVTNSFAVALLSAVTARDESVEPSPKAVYISVKFELILTF